MRVLLAGIILCWVNLVFADAEDVRLNKSMSLFVYNEAFAERFGLPVSHAVALDPGLLALELKISPDNIGEWGSVHHPYQCDIHLYLDSRLDILYPYEDWGNVTIFNQLVFQSKAPLPHVSPQDNAWLFAYEQPGVFIRSRALEKFEGKLVPVQSIPYQYRFYRKYWLPEISYLALSGGYGSCNFLNKSYGDVVIWLEKNLDAKQSEKHSNSQYADSPDDFFEFSLVDEIIESPYLKKAIKMNKSAVRTGLKKRFADLKDEDIEVII